MDYIPPQCPDIERLIIASFFVECEVFYKYSPEVTPDMFWVTAHQEIVEYMQANTCQDAAVISERFPQHIHYIADCVGNGASALNLSAHIDILRDRHNRRKIIDAASRLSDKAANDLKTTAKEIAGELQEVVFDVMKDASGKPVHIATVLPEVFELMDTKTEPSSLKSGLVDLDELTGGFLPSEYTIVAARPSMGKSSLALKIARNISIVHHESVLIFSVEMSKQITVGRILCSEASVCFEQTMRHTLPQREYPRLSLAAGPIAEAPIFIDDTPAISISQIMMRAEQFKSLHNIKMIIIDHGGFVKAGQRLRSKHEEITEISHGLQATGKKLDIAVLLLWQLSRSVEIRHPPIPMLSDLRESGTLEEDADKVILLYRESYYDKSLPQNGPTDLIIAKNRNGGTGSRQVYFDGPTMDFRTLERKHEEPRTDF